MIHSANLTASTSSDYSYILKKLGRMDGRCPKYNDNLLCENDDHLFGQHLVGQFLKTSYIISDK